MHFWPHCTNGRVGKPTRGFGLVELMVSISIMMILTTIIIVRQSSFNGAVLLRSQAYEIAFTLRRAQLLAVSGNNRGVADVTTSIQQYGVYFDTDAPNTYILFHDLNANGQWDGAPIDAQVGAPGTIDKRFEIRAISDGNGVDIAGGGVHTGYSVTFIRPNFDAKFQNTIGSSYDSFNAVYIYLAQVNKVGDEPGTVRRVEISKTGQISVTSFE
jgi:type II secretory pathway pseudopilin PulG